MTTPASAEPTAEQLSVAMQLITSNSTHGGDARIDFADAIARALAAAVTAEREKVLAIHRRAHETGPTSCVECNKGRKFVEWPCATAQALGIREVSS